MPLYDSPRLIEGLSLQKLLTTGVGELVLNEEDIAFKDVPDNERLVETAYDFDEYKDRVNLDVITCDAKDLGLAETTFDSIGKGMTNLTPDGKVKKRLVVPGTDPVPKDAMVYVNYDFYLEMQEVPIDSSYIRLGKPERLQVGQNNQILGFDIAVSSMAIGEKSHFLIHHDYAFGKMGSPPRIPAESSILAVVKIVEVVDCGLVHEEKELTADELKSFAVIGPRAEAENNLAKDYFMRKRVATAVYHYCSEERMLVQCAGSNPDDEKARKERLFKVYLNLAVCYNHRDMNDSVRALFMAEKAISVDEERAVRSAKLFYNRGVARSDKGEYQLALKDFKKAQFIEPKNKEVANKMLWLERKLAEADKVEREMSIRALGGHSTKNNNNSNTTKTDLGALSQLSAVSAEDKPESLGHDTLPQSTPSAQPEEADYVKQREGPDGADKDEMDASVAEFLDNFKKSRAGSHNLGYGFTPAERRVYREQCERLGLVYEELRTSPLRREVVISKPNRRTN